MHAATATTSKMIVDLSFTQTKLGNIFNVIFHPVIVSYFPSADGQELAPFQVLLEGCQRVIEPVLSPLLYKSITSHIELCNRRSKANHKRF